MTSTRRHDPSVLLEIAAALLVPAGVFGFIRVFADIDMVLPIIGASLMSTALAVALRRFRVPLLAAALISLTGLAILLVNRYAPGTSRFGIVPTRASLDQLDLLLTDGLDQFRALRAPVPDLAPFIAATIIAAWIMAFLTDWGALRLRLAFEPVLPAGLLFIFSAVLGAGDRRILSTVVFAGAVVFWAVAQRTSNLIDHSVWLSADRQRGPLGVARSAALVSLAALLAGLLIGPRLPGADDEELYYWRNRSDPTRVVVSPFVQIGSRLVEQTDVDLFQVTADAPAYWRLAGLDTYNEETASWSTTLKFESTEGELPGLQARAGTTIALRQDIEIQNLGDIWLPAAFAPARVVDSTNDAIWNEETASLAVSKNEDEDGELFEGLAYTVESVVPLYTAEELNSASNFVPPAIRDRFLPVPASLSPRVLDEALSITAGATTRYEQAAALEAYFREFDYSLQLTRREGDPVEQFLDERVGFCQQFSGTFALMARSLGLPTRVAVGFTWGDPIPSDDADDGPTTYQITGRHTHAWPEVWFDGLGWVAFEPTPGRGNPNAAYTGVEERQDSLVQENFDQEPEADPSTTTPTTEALNIEDFVPDSGALDGADLGAGASSGRNYGPTWLWIGLAVIATYAIGMPLLFRFRRARRHRQAATAPAKIEALWADAADDLSLAFDLQRRPSETRSEFARRVAADSRVPDDAIIELADAVTTARYADPDAAAAVLSKAEGAAAAIHTRMSERTTAWQRWRLQATPRRLVRATDRVVHPAI